MKMLLDFLYPKICPGCEKINENTGATFCRKCYDDIIFVGKDYCIKCGKPIDGSRALCMDCEKKKRCFEEHRATYVYKGKMRHAMYGLKYSNKREFAKWFARDLVMKNGEWLNGLLLDAIIPVPMYKTKEKMRGYNQAYLVAKEISKLINVPVDNSVIKRCKNTVAMKNLNDVQRRINLENAFICNAFKVEYSRLLLVDDIFTTGATFDTISKVLKENGVYEVYCISVCVGWGS